MVRTAAALACIVLASLAFAGCSVDSPAPPLPEATESQTPLPSWPPSFGPPVQVAAIAAQDASLVTYASAKQLALFEPTLAFGDGGLLYVSAPHCPAADGACADHPSGIWQGPAAGPFRSVRPQAEEGVSGNGDSFVLLVDGTLYLVDQGGGTHQVYRSPDDGVTWSRSEAVTGMPDRPWMDGRGDDLALTFWRAGAQHVVRSHDGAATWDDGVQVARTTYPGGPIRIVDRTTWALPLLQETDALPAVGGVEKCGPRSVEVHAAVSRDSGASWTLVDTGARYEDSGEQGLGGCAPSATMPSFVVDGSGRWHIAWSEPNAAGQILRVVSSPDSGTTWTPATSPRGEGGAAVLPWLASRGSNDIALAYYVSGLDADANVNAGPWRLEVAWSGDGGATWQVADLGKAHDGPVCTGGAGCRTTDRSLGDFVHLAVGSEGQLGVAWTADLPFPVKGSQVLVAVAPS
ncbi:MAG: sialidase family protein [Thermoplasmatota archaeon]